MHRLTRVLGLMVATAISAVMVSGAVGLVVMDFTRATFDQPRTSSPPPVEQETGDQTRRDDVMGRLEQMSTLNFFKEEKVPGTGLLIMTGTAYGSVSDLIADRSAKKWCYLQRKETGSVFGNRIDLGQQDGPGAPQFVSPDKIARDHAALFGTTPDKLAAYARQYCRFDFDGENE